MGIAKKAFPALFLAAILAAGAAVIYKFDPTASALYPKCLFNHLTGMHCPGCGSTRALHALAHGRLRDALSFNLLLTAGAPVLLAAWAAHRFKLAEGRFMTARKLSGWIALAIVLLFFLLRNIPAYPFNLLAP